MVETNKSNVLLTTYTERERQVARHKILLFVNEAPTFNFAGKVNCGEKFVILVYLSSPVHNLSNTYLLNKTSASDHRLNYQNSLGVWYRMRFLSIVRIADDERKRERPRMIMMILNGKEGYIRI